MKALCLGLCAGISVIMLYNGMYIPLLFFIGGLLIGMLSDD